MRISLIKGNKLLKYKLPNRVDGNLWLNETDNNGIERNIINVESTPEGKWRLVSNSDYYVVQDTNKVSSIILEENSIIIINHAYSYDNLILLTEPTYDKSLSFFPCKNELSIGITIGNSESSTINYGLNLLGNNDLIIRQVENNIVITNQNTKTNYFINDIKAEINEVIKPGDVIYYLGLKLILIKINGEYIIGINNALNLVKTFMKPYSINEISSSNLVEESSEEKDIELYSQDDYFYRKPRFIYSISPLDINIDQPPAKADSEEMPFILVVGPMLTMSMTSVMTFYATMNNINSGNTTIKKAMPQLVMSIAMMLSFFLWPLVTNAFQKHVRKKRENKRQKKYNEYIEGLSQKIIQEKNEQEEIMKKKYLSLPQIEKVINDKEDRLWEKRVFEEDFLTISLGSGILPMNINLNYPDDHFSMVEDKLVDKMKELKNNNFTLDNVPIPFSFRTNYISAIVGKDNLQRKIMKNILLQLMAFHSYESLKVAIFTSKEKEKNWEYLKSLPHLWSNDKNFRFFASNSEEYKELTYNLDKIYNERLEKTEENSEEELYNPNYLIIVDTYTAVRNLDLFFHLINSKKYLGFSIVILNDRISNLPDQCQTFIELGDQESKVSSNISNTESQKFKIDMTYINIEKCISNISNTPLELKDEGAGAIPKKVGFLELYGLGKIEQFNSKIRWQDNTPIMNMAALVGVGNNGEKISLDLHEKYHGPHGLIAGMTGSGKSEFLITYILSLAVNYHPDEVQFILIDYKGGGLAGAFENQNIGIKLPHLVGVITNLDKNEINRSLVSIESELKRRQALFNEAREKSEESTIDIYKYQEMYRKGIVNEPVSHLLIIADEFAELKQQQPEFMEQLISTARIGRSLGVHLILATQKPSGVVDSQIWSNTRFRVCFRVQEKNDSTEVIKRPDAAYLTQTGRFYLQVGFNEVFMLGQSAWAGGKYIPSENIKKNIDTSVEFVNNIGYVINSIETKKEVVNTVNMGEELINIVKYLSNLAEEENIKTKPLWLSRIPTFILVGDLIKKYKYTKQNFVLNPIIGEYDVPTMQEQRLLTIPFSKEGNVLVYGIAGSGKENFISTLLFSSMVAYSPSEVNFYILDFGSESLKYYDNSPYVGDIIYSNDNEKIENLFKMIQKEMTNRKNLFANYNGDYMTYCKNSGSPVPNIIIVINNFEGFQESYPNYDDLINILTRDCVKYGIYFVLTVNTPNGVRFKLKQNFGQTFALNQNNEEDYSTIIGNNRKVFPSKGLGRGIIKKDGVYEFQTAFITEMELIPDYIKKVNEQYSSKYSVRARRVPILPEIISYSDVSYGIKQINDIVLGVNKDDLSTMIYNFNEELINVITSVDQSLFDVIITPIVYQFINKKQSSNIIINAENISFDDVIKKNTTYVDSNFNSIFDSISNFIKSCKEVYEKNNRDKTIFKEISKINCIIFGVNSFKMNLDEERQNKFAELFDNVNDLGIINYIFVDTVDKLKKFSYDSWFKDNYNSNNGIYIGNGLSDQMLINVTKRIPEMKEEVPYNFGFVVKKGIPIYIKFVEKYK